VGDEEGDELSNMELKAKLEAAIAEIDAANATNSGADGKSAGESKD